MRIVSKDNKPVLQEESQADQKIGNCLFISIIMKRIRRLIYSVANNTFPVIILGETGVGKSALANAIHLTSSRKDQPFIRVNCANLQDSLIENELFGHEKGSFTGATHKKPGYFELANGGTLFLDEIGELSPKGQAALLCVLDSGKYMPVGGTKEYTSTARIIVGTNKDLSIEQGTTFRKDLYQRLSVWPITMPSLDARREEIPILAKEFLQRHGSEGFQLSSCAEQFLKTADYPGNLRTLENYIKRGIGIAQSSGDYLITEETLLTVEQLFEGKSMVSPKLTVKSSVRLVQSEVEKSFDRRTLEFERDLLLKALVANQGNKTLTAQFLNMDRKRLSRLIVKANITKDQIQSQDNVNSSMTPCDFDDQVKSFQEQIVKEAITLHKGRKTLAAESLNIAKRSLYRIMGYCQDTAH